MPNSVFKNDDKQVNIKLVIEYDGKNYFGWQRQKKAKSIQQTIEDALTVIFRVEKVTIVGAGRTDAGVHAYNQCANFKIDKKKFESTGINRLFSSLNGLLPDDIVVKKINIVPVDFSSRYSAKSREYIYRITDTPRAIDGDKLYYIKFGFNLKEAKEFCKAIQGKHSFLSLCKNKEDDHDFMCDIMKAVVKIRKDGIIEFTITANRFLHSMVRAIVGTMLKVASGKLTLNEFNAIFKKGDEIKTQYVPAKALFLSKVNY